MSISKGDGKGKYLGLPYMTGRSKKEIFAHVREKVWKKLHGWKEKLLSPGGREVLIKSVLQAIPMYVMQCFMLPKSLINSITSMARKFFWGGTDSTNKISWKSWEICCRPKHMGGLGFRDMELFNKALLAKQVWRVLQSPASLVSQILEAKYYSQRTILEASLGSRPSFLWRSLLEGRDFLNMGLRWRIGDGQRVRVFQDPWITLEPYFQPIYGLSSLSYDATVNSLMLPGQRRWNTMLIRREFLDFEADRILEIPLSSSQHTDRIVWHYDRKGIYSVKSGYLVGLNHKLQQDGLTQHYATTSKGNHRDKWLLTWNLPIQPRLKHFLWRALHDCLPTSKNLHRRGVSDGICGVCGHEIETLDHCLISCAIPRAVAAHSTYAAKWFARKYDSIGGLLECVKDEEGVDSACHLVNLLWYIWKARCGWIFDQQPIYISRLCNEAFTNAAEYFEANAKEMREQRNLAENVTWRKPQPGYAKINVDGSIKDDTAAVGIIVRRFDGNILHSVSKHVSFSCKPEGVELMAIKEGLVVAHNLGLACVEMESDSLLAVSRLRSHDQDLSDLGTIAQDIHLLASLFSSVIFSYAKRVCNVPAHLLAQHGLGPNSHVEWGTYPPANVLAAVANDLL